MRFPTVLAICVWLAACATDGEKPLEQLLPDCGFKEAPNLVGNVRTEFPVIREGGPFVGIATQEWQPEGSWSQRYTLLNCKTRDLWQVHGSGPSIIPPEKGESVFELVDHLRREGRLIQSGQLHRMSVREGLDYMSGKPRSEDGRVKCACDLIGMK